MNSQLKLSIVKNVNEKICSNPNCEQKNPQSFNNFWKGKGYKFGLTAQCKYCLGRKNKEYAIKFPERVKESVSKSIKKHYKKIREKTKKYFKENPHVYRQSRWKSFGIKNADGSWFKWHDYQVMLAQQNNMCAICLKSEPGGRGTWHVDHDHFTGIARGVLCQTCNFMLGSIKDDIEKLKSAIRYLENFNTRIKL